MCWRGGYDVPGNVSTVGGAALPFSIRLYDLTAKTFSPPATVSASGQFNLAAPPGTHRVFSETIVSSVSAYFEDITVGFNVNLGEVLLSWKGGVVNVIQGPLPTTTNLTLDFNVPPSVFFLPRNLYLRQNTSAGRNWVDREVSTTPIVTAVPRATYSISIDADIALSTGLTELYSDLLFADHCPGRRFQDFGDPDDGGDRRCDFRAVRSDCKQREHFRINNRGGHIDRHHERHYAGGWVSVDWSARQDYLPRRRNSRDISRYGNRIPGSGNLADCRDDEEHHFISPARIFDSEHHREEAERNRFSWRFGECSVRKRHDSNRGIVPVRGFGSDFGDRASVNETAGRHV